MTQTQAQQPTTTPSKAELASSLRALANQMRKVATEMDYYGGFSVVAQHGKELFGASCIALDWADAIAEDPDIAERP
ncbi:hypothetical protein [Denitrificimonas caeni]|uniref:hypothetical protein n=1 Tax=Denitrificimonas caeni TaxID=521720 RepID=UPI001962C3CD|nr:hypothetical protein [Denitrificimonas caeni]